MCAFVIVAHAVPLPAELDDGAGPGGEAASGSNAPAAMRPADIALDDLPAAGRLDLLARCVGSALLVSHDVRADAEIHVVCRDAATIRIDGAAIRNLHPDERSIAARLRDALCVAPEAIGRQPADVAPGIAVRRGGLAATLDDRDGPIVQCVPDGGPLPDVAAARSDATFVLSDHRPFSEADHETIAARRDARASLGPRAIHADDAIAVVHNALDTDGYQEYDPAE